MLFFIAILVRRICSYFFLFFFMSLYPIGFFLLKWSCFNVIKYKSRKLHIYAFYFWNRKLYIYAFYFLNRKLFIYAFYFRNRKLFIYAFYFWNRKLHIYAFYFSTINSWSLLVKDQLDSNCPTVNSSHKGFLKGLGNLIPTVQLIVHILNTKPYFS